ncbi:MAG: hypothetical protein C6P37_00695 [Caldibacillus debilis]|uniref:Uncharacterized protein n=1 Tax=Caldibacillus debilis TaxID=301148 RepID=A0A150LMU4_9BACI|nr:hypothetical protein B4135_2886 [Caldibacillus debilis]MBO2482653.1 hypothetical protein [Bacillaceae bacterium]MBY6270693.1 hypothetical protein [Bacillaceae bacterium]OUM91208.1 MAG: hypothetical protein BAA03_02250 [Caldibacillus debilis]REJ19267.1 MAG: hypothetical protein C6W57_01545 [Caldibacillus debilis]
MPPFSRQDNLILTPASRLDGFLRSWTIEAVGPAGRLEKTSKKRGVPSYDKPFRPKQSTANYT